MADIAKSDPYIVMISTPNAPGGLFEAIEKEPEETCIYKRIKLDYTYGLDRIFTRQEIEKAKTSPSFEREYDLKYLGRIGNTFHTADIERAISIKYNPDYINKFAACSMGLDPAWGSSNFGIVITQLGDSTEEDPGGAEGSIQVLYAEEFEKPEHSEILDTVVDLIHRYNVTKVYIDGANPSFIRSLKIQIGEDTEYERVIERAHHDKFDFGEIMRVIPINFSTDHKKMLGHTKMLVENGLIAIDATRFDKLVASLRTAVDNEGKLDKEATTYDDIFDAFRLSLKMYYLE